MKNINKLQEKYREACIRFSQREKRFHQRKVTIPCPSTYGAGMPMPSVLFESVIVHSFNPSEKWP